MQHLRRNSSFQATHSGYFTTAMNGSLTILGTLVAFAECVAEEARTRGFASPAFAGFAFIVRR